MTKEQKTKRALLPKSNAKTALGLLSDVVKVITEEPKRYNQGIWLDKRNGPITDDSHYPACGTIGCVAGWAITLKRKRLMKSIWGDMRTSDTAGALLGLNNEQQSELFGDHCVRRLTANGEFTRIEPQTIEHVKAGVEHIRKFQRKYRAQLLRTRV